MPEERIHVLVVDDTVTYRQLLKRVVEGIEGCEVVGVAANGKIALSKMAATPVDLVVLDVEMPEMGGLETLEVIRREHPLTGVVMVSGANAESATSTVRALERGALDFIRKPDEGDITRNEQVLREQLTELVRLFAIRHKSRLLRERRKPETASAKPPPRFVPAPQETEPARPLAALPTHISVIGIAVSTGGPNALQEVIPRLPADIGVPILMVQHMPPLFTASLAESLARRSALPVREAVEGEAILPNQVLIAPGGSHMIVRRDPERPEAYRVGISDAPPENSCRPSADVLFRSIAAHYAGNMMAVVMTGMGADGMKGVRAMKQRGCLCLTQDEASCTIYGMPQAVVAAGLSDEAVPLDYLARRIVDYVRNPGAAR